MNDLYAIPLKTIDGKETSLAAYAGNVLLIVNTASKCGLTPQYEGLEALHTRYKDQGFTVLGFPANDFAGQEPGTDSEIQSFCSLTYDVDFPMFSKIVVTGKNKHPLYAALTGAPVETQGSDGFRALLANRGREPLPEPEVLWNFEKFLVARNGEVVGRFSPDMAPMDPHIVTAVERELKLAE